MILLYIYKYSYKNYKGIPVDVLVLIAVHMTSSHSDRQKGHILYSK